MAAARETGDETAFEAGRRSGERMLLDAIIDEVLAE